MKEPSHGKAVTRRFSRSSGINVRSTESGLSHPARAAGRMTYIPAHPVEMVLDFVERAAPAREAGQIPIGVIQQVVGEMRADHTGYA